MIVSLEKPGTPQELVHHGVKGMKWGHRKALDISSLNARSKEYIKALEPPAKVSVKEAKKNLAANQKKFQDKFQSSSSEHRLTPEQKKILIGVGIGVGVLAVAGGSYYAYRKYGGGGKLPLSPHALAGKPVDLPTFEQLTKNSIAKTWIQDGTYVQPSSFSRPAFELPKGHTFFRMSYDAEKTFEPTTYVTHTLSDANRYLLGNPHAGHRLTFQSTESVKIPHITTVLDTLKQVIEEDAGSGISDKEVLKSYQRIAGSNWKSTTAVKLIKGLTDKGYGGVVDEMDAGVFADHPLVVFGDHFTPKISNPITDEMRQTAEKGLTEIMTRKL